MRNILSDLQTRLDELNTERQVLHEQLNEIDAVEASLLLLLEQEQKRWNKQLSLGFADEKKNIHVSQSPLSQAILKLLSDGQEWQLKKLTNAVMQMDFNFGKKKAGRVLHFALVGMSQHGLVEKVSNGVWRIGSKAKVEA